MVQQFGKYTTKIKKKKIINTIKKRQKKTL